MTNQHARNLGILSSFLAAIFTVIFGAFLVLDNQRVYFTACLFLSLSVVIMAISLKAFVSREKTVFIDSVVAFVIMYALCVSMVYYTQISVVLSGTLSKDALAIVSDSPGSVFFYLDMFGYCLLCFATLFMAFAIDSSNKLLRGIQGRKTGFSTMRGELEQPSPSTLLCWQFTISGIFQRGGLPEVPFVLRFEICLTIGEQNYDFQAGYSEGNSTALRELQWWFLA